MQLIPQDIIQLINSKINNNRLILRIMTYNKVVANL